MPDNLPDVTGLMSADIMAAPVRWLCSPAAAGVHDQRIVANEFQDWLSRR